MTDLKKECSCGRDVECQHCCGAGYVFDVYAIKDKLDAAESHNDVESGRYFTEILLEHLVLDSNTPSYIKGIIPQLETISSVLFSYAKDEDKEIDIFARRYEGFSGST